MWKSICKHFKLKETIRPEIAQEHDQLANEDRIAPHNSDGGFRVLILGPANAGKTTLLERLTESPAGAAIVTRNGRRVILHFLHRYSGLIYSLTSQINEVPRGYDQVRAIASARCGCLMFLSYLARYPQCRRRNYLRIKP